LPPPPPRAPSERIAAPSTLLAGRYELLELVGKGALGAVHKARDHELERIVALKCVLDATRNVTRETAIREARTLASVAHQNVMRVYDVLTAGEQVFIVCEWLEGTSLARLGLPLAPAVVFAVMTQVFAGLAAAHAAGVVHRDVKPANVMIGRDGRVTLIDFGVAFAEGASTGETLAGSLRYLDPRILAGEPPDALADLFSAALLMAEMATGETVLPDLAPIPLYRHATRQLESRLASQLDGVYPPLAAVVRRLACKERTRTLTAEGAAREMADATFAALAQLTTRTPEQFLVATAGTAGEAVEAESDAACDVAARRTLETAGLTPRQKAAWVAYVAARTAREATPRAAPGPVRHAPPPKSLAAGWSFVSTSPRPKRRRVIVATLVAGAALALGAGARARWGKSGAPPVAAARADGTDGATPPGRGPFVGPPRLVLTADVAAAAVAAQSAAAAASAEAALARTKHGQVYIAANAWAVVMIDGKKAGRIPQAAPFVLPEGTHTLALVNPSVEPFRTSFRADPAHELRLSFTLKPKEAAQKFVLKVPGRLYVDGRDQGFVAVKTLRLAHGSHRVRVARIGAKSAEFSIALGPGSPKEIVVE
jgi:tRNA A-37 threonylcarbamoyl transferase component Bud32